MTPDADLHTLTGAYLLDALSEAEQHRFEAHLAECERCARDVAELRPGVGYLQAVADEVPPSGLRDRIVERARSDDGSSTAASTVTRLPDRGALGDPGRRSPLRLVAAAAAVLVVAVAGLSVTAIDLAGQRDDAQLAADRFADLLAAPDVTVTAGQGEAGPRGRVIASASRGEAVVVLDDLPPAPRDRTYQLWLIDERGITSAGLLVADADGRATTSVTGELDAEVVVGLTVEPAGGSPQPTSDPILAIELA